MDSTEEIPDITLNDFTYGDKPLGEWEEKFTIILPRQPAQSQEVSKCLADVHNAYQLAYNCFSELEVVCKVKNNILNTTKNVAIAAKISEYKGEGARLPGRDILESLALSTDRCKVLLEDVQMYELIMEFFENHKNKLEKCMQLCIAVQYAVKSNDKIHDIGAR